MTMTHAVAPQTDPVAAARDAVPVLAGESAVGDAARKLTDTAVDALERAGQFRTLTPPRHGGTGADLGTAVDAAAELAKADPAAAWVVMILDSGDFLTGLFAERAIAEVYAGGPDTRVCAVLTPRAVAEPVSGGWRVSGAWAPASGCLHARWAILGFQAPHPDGPVPTLGLVPMADLDIRDTWFTLGMRATGSNLLHGENIVIPRHRTVAWGQSVRGEPGPGSERRAVVPTLATYLLGPLLGIADAAWEYAVGAAHGRGVSFTSYRRQSDSTAFQLAVASAAARIDTARLLAHRCADTVEHAPTYPDYLTRARVRLHVGAAVRHCRAAVDDLVSAHGSAALGETNPLQRLMRDMHTASRHSIADPVVNEELFGRAVLGTEPNITDLV